MKLKLTIYPVLLGLLLTASPVSAQVYKCTSSSNKVIYSDKTCTSGGTQILTDIQTRSKSQENSADNALPTDKSANNTTDSAINRQLDEAVKLAIGNDDLIRAQALATTKEQKQWVTAARKEATKKLASADSRADKADSYDCRQAQRNLQKVSDTTLPDQNLILSKTSLMYSKCGISVADLRYANRVPSSLYNPGFFNRGFFNPGGGYGHNHHQHWPGNAQPGYTSEPYDRTMASPFGSRFIRPEN
ncbi:MAG TPA: hypothetical protein VK974_08230 [Methylophilaceae bacterium]|nr:hypothetical protein [Methylophilaceae bacterium]